MALMRQHYDYFLVMQFVDSRFNSKRDQIYLAFEKFINHVGPVLEDVRVKLSVVRSRAYGLIRTKDIKTDVERDLKNAKDFLNMYDSSFKEVHQIIESVHSNESAREFLIQQGIKIEDLPEQINLFLEEVGFYWEATYGVTFSKLQRARGLLAKMTYLLKYQIDLLESLNVTNYFDGFDKSKELREVFESEYDAFQEMRKILAFSNKEVSKVESLYRIQILNCL